jgi:Ca2+-dependent lipid-binding protein
MRRIMQLWKQAARRCLQVAVLEARDIPRMDRMGTSDPSVTLFTDPKRKVSTATKKNTLNPKWDGEEFYLMVQARPPAAH